MHRSRGAGPAAAAATTADHSADARRRRTAPGARRGLTLRLVLRVVLGPTRAVRGRLTRLLEPELGHGILHLLDPARVLGPHDPLGLVDEAIRRLLATLIGGREGDPPRADRAQIRCGLVVERDCRLQLP